MKLSEAPSWIVEFLQKKAPWWLEEGADLLTIISVNDRDQTARVSKGKFVYTLDSRHNYIR